jgi:hypothetical protein
MRLPGRKIWRAFPELDRFNDLECERFVRRAVLVYRNSKRLTYLATFAGLAMAIPAAWGLISVLWGLSRGWFSRRQPAVFRVLDGPDGRVFAGVFFVAVIAFTFLLVRDRWLIRTINSKLRRTNCQACGYSLLGLTPDRGVVECPECKRPFFLNDAGLVDEDLMVG